jgi:hypothetical protein
MEHHGLCAYVELTAAVYGDLRHTIQDATIVFVLCHPGMDCSIASRIFKLIDR